MSTRTTRTGVSATDAVIRLAIVALALGTGYIHSTLGGLIFTLNALGYLVAAAAIVVPLGLAVRYRWLIRLGMIGYAATTIGAWAIQGPYYSTAFLAKGIEVVLISLLVIEVVRLDGNPVRLIRREIARLATTGLPLPGLRRREDTGGGAA